MRATSALAGAVAASAAGTSRARRSSRSQSRADQAPERVRIRRIPDVTKDTLTGFALDNVARGSAGPHRRLAGLLRRRPLPVRHVVTNVSATGDAAHVALPHVHLVSSLLKRWMLGTHQGAVNHAQLDYYLDEFTFRFNRRRAGHRGLLFHRLLEGALVAEPHPYKALTGKSAA
jgi:hypothetical protein